MSHSSFLATLLCALAALLAGCATRPISDSGYPDRNSYRASSNPMYKGELSEFAVLGIDPNESISEQDIAAAGSARERVALKRGANIMLLQSGTLIPDEDMLKAAHQYFGVTPFSGAPEARTAKDGEPAAAGYSRALRLAAARAGAQFIVCYWGLLESRVDSHGTKLVSWIPIAGSVLPDETQQMSIRLKFVVMDVKSGQWTTLQVDPFDDKALSNRLSRESSDQQQVGLLKRKAYQQAVEALLRVVI
jgi:hypothetical protein